MGVVAERKLPVRRCGIPHLAKNERDVGHPRSLRCDGVLVKRSLGFARHFRPTYAGANVGHPSHSRQFVPTLPELRPSKVFSPSSLPSRGNLHLSRTAYDADCFNGWIATLLDACAWGLRKTGCAAAGAAKLPAQAGLETGSGYSYCGGKRRAGTTVVGPPVGCDCGAGAGSGDAVAESCSRRKNVLPAIRQHG
jgi:hypothetical protein